MVSVTTSIVSCVILNNIGWWRHLCVNIIIAIYIFLVWVASSSYKILLKQIHDAWMLKSPQTSPTEMKQIKIDNLIFMTLRHVASDQTLVCRVHSVTSVALTSIVRRQLTSPGTKAFATSRNCIKQNNNKNNGVGSMCSFKILSQRIYSTIAIRSHTITASMGVTRKFSREGHKFQTQFFCTTSKKMAFFFAFLGLN